MESRTCLSQSGRAGNCQGCRRGGHANIFVSKLSDGCVVARVSCANGSDLDDVVGKNYKATLVVRVGWQGDLGSTIVDAQSREPSCSRLRGGTGRRRSGVLVFVTGEDHRGEAQDDDNEQDAVIVSGSSLLIGLAAT